MAGRMGGDQTTVKNLKVVLVDNEKNLIGISGAIPGTIGGLVTIKRLSENKVVVKQVEEVVAPEVVEAVVENVEEAKNE